MFNLSPFHLARLTAALWALTLATTTARAQAPSWDWAQCPGGGAGANTVTDGLGNVYVAGVISGTATFGTTTLTTAGSMDVFVAKLSATGTCQWTVQAGGTDWDQVSGLALDSAGNVYVSGYFRSPTVVFGPDTLTNVGNNDAFIAKLSSAGAWLWAKGPGGAGVDQISSIALDAMGNIYASGLFGSTITLGATTLTSSGQADAFVAKLSPAGSWEWATRAGGSDFDAGYMICLDRNGEAYVVGRFDSPTATFGSLVVTNASPNLTGDFFVAKLTASGHWQWAVGAGGVGEESALKLVLDTSANVYVTGSFSSPTLTIGSTTLTGSSTLAMFLAKLSPTGTWQWAQAVNSSGRIGNVRGLAIDGANNVYTAGGFLGTAGFGTTTLTSVGRADIFVAKWAPAGTCEWAVRAGSINDDFIDAMALDSDSNVYLTGHLTVGAPCTFGNIILPNTGSLNPLFLARLTPAPLGLSAQSAEASELLLAPNPARETVQLTGATAPTAEIIDALGRTVRTANLEPGTSHLNLKGLPPGLYTVRAGSAARRLVVE